MRKWMQDKLKRRKKSEEAAATGPAPLQPAYFEAAPEANRRAPHSVEAPEEPVAKAEPQSTQDPSVPVDSRERDATAPADGVRRPRRRRRGGRGRKRPGQQNAPQQSPTADSTAVPSAPSARSTPAAAAAQQPSKGIVVLAVGLPGSGKSSWFKRHNITPLSSDVLRSMLFDDPAEQRFQDLVFSNLRSMLKARLIARRPTNYVDATNLTPHERNNWVKLAKDFGYEAQAVFFDVPLEVCIERHNRRDRIVPEDVMRKMSAKLKAPTFDEGFAKITVVRVKQKAE
ncbi:MAG: AAA family ATPase [Terriglobales bacterium]